MEQRNATVDAGFVVELDRFQGPLDLLLHLIREQDVDIFDIPISRITQQFLAAIDGVEALGLDRAGEFLEMAATLVRIKVQLLLPRPLDEDGELEDPRAELVRRLLEYEHFREVAHCLEAGEAARSRLFGRGYVPPRPPPPVAEAPLELGWEELWRAVLAIAERARVPGAYIVASRAVPLEEKIALIVEALAELRRVEFRRLVEPFGDRLHAVMTLLAGLELSRRRAALLRQRAPFAELWIHRTNRRDTGRLPGDRALLPPDRSAALSAREVGGGA
jgi:segregation and condensation protein A